MLCAVATALQPDSGTMQPFTLFLLKTLRSPPHASSFVVKINGCRAQLDKLVVSKLVVNTD